MHLQIWASTACVLLTASFGFGAESPRMHFGDPASGRPFSKDPAVVRFRARYWLYYSLPPCSGKPTKGWSIGVAQSTNLVDWEKVAQLVNSGEAERNGFCAPGAIVRGDRVHLFYQTYGNGPQDAICHAWSDDGVHFTRDPTNPVFRPTGEWNCGRAIDADVIEHNGRLLMYWATRDKGFKVQMLGVAAAPADSDFGRGRWKQLNLDGPILKPELPWERRCIEAPAACKRGGRLYLFYAGGYNNEPQQIGVAVSEDGVRFTRTSPEPFFPNGPPGSWNSSESGHPFLFQDEGRDYLFYQGNNDRGKTWYLSVVPVDWKGGRPVPSPQRLPKLARCDGADSRSQLAVRNVTSLRGDAMKVQQTQASSFARLALKAIQKEYPNKPEHVINGAADVRGPRTLHPAFYGSFDWHSSVHGHWMLVHLLRLFPNLPEKQEIRTVLGESLTAKNLQAEAGYFLQPNRQSFERTYGWAWLLKLAEELHGWDDPDGKRWSGNLRPLTDIIVARYLAYFPKQTYPIRTGVHPNTAFGLSFALDYARSVGHKPLQDLIEERSRFYYAKDTAVSAAWEPGGTDFFSPSLIEADLMRRVLPPEEFHAWLRGFLPGLEKGEPKALFTPAQVTDRSDPQLVHLDGLNLSRVWCMRSIAAALPKDDPAWKVLSDSATRHAEAALHHVASGDYAGEHWLATFAVYPPRVTDPKGFEDVPATSNLPLRSGKASLYEGGTRAPCIIVWPGKVQPGTTNEALLQSVDFYPTLLAMAGLRPHADVKLDGVDQTAALLGQGAVRDRVFCHFPHGSERQAVDIPGFLPGTYVRKGNWKLIRFFADNEDGSDRFELYSLKDDIGETKNLAAAKPEVVTELNALITGFLKDTEAVIPVRNPDYGKIPADPADPLGGWKARSCQATVKAGMLTVIGKGPSPFLGFAMGKEPGPAVIRFRARCAAGGTGKIEWLPSGKADMPNGTKSVPFRLAGGVWEETRVDLPGQGPLGILRIYLPAQKQSVELDWIGLRTPGTLRRWEF